MSMEDYLSIFSKLKAVLEASLGLCCKESVGQPVPVQNKSLHCQKCNLVGQQTPFKTSLGLLCLKHNAYPANCMRTVVESTG